MSLKLAIMKFGARRKRKAEVNKHSLGERFKMPRTGKSAVDVSLYRPKDSQAPLPALFNLHGGAWVGCDASQMDSYCLDMAEKCGAFIVNVNYTKLDVKAFPYPQEEIRDTVLYFRDHATEYGLDSTKFALIGYSAGGHLAAAATLMLKDAGLNISAQVLCYPFLDFTRLTDLMGGKSNSTIEEFFFPKGVSKTDPYISPGLAIAEQLDGIAPAIFVVCGTDPLTAHSVAYREKLELAGIRTEYKLYDEALHGFLEVNHKEYPPQQAKTPEQERLAKDAEDYIAIKLKEIWRYQT